MKIKLLTIAGLLFLSGCGGSKDAARQKPVIDTDALLSYQSEITTDYLRTHLSVIAADSMEGRDTGSQGLEKAATYLAQQYREMGLRPLGDNQTYYQHFDLKASVTDSIVFELFAVEDGHKAPVERSVASQKSTANFIRGFGGTDTLSGEIVFAGFGLNDPSNEVSHLGDMDLKGKWVMVFEEIPYVIDGDTLVNPAISPQSRLRSVVIQGGAEGLLLIPSATAREFEQLAAQSKAGFGQPAGMRLPYLKGRSGGFAKGYNIINPALAAQILGLEDGIKGLNNLRRSLTEEITGFTPTSTGHVLVHTPYLNEVTIETKNVLALLEGADAKLKDEVVILTSHYDHVGIGRPDSTGDNIYNGADDDGSGTVGLLNIAHALAGARDNGVAPRRSILFLHVSAEEKGLLGSRYYSDHPVLPIEKTVANINIDMIGRIDQEHEEKGIEDYAYIIGSEIISSQMDSMLTVANNRSGNIILDKKYNDLNDPNQFYRRSDHWNFGRLGVPFVFFFTGVHEDYHQPGDEVEKILFDKMAKIVRTIYATSVIVANNENPPEVDNQAFINITKGI